MKKLINCKRGVNIGGYISQPLSLLASDGIARRMKEEVRVRCFLLQCDDCLMLARTKAEAWKYFNEYQQACEARGIILKASYKVAPIAHLAEGNEKKRHRKRQRGRGRREV